MTHADPEPLKPTEHGGEPERQDPRHADGPKRASEDRAVKEPHTDGAEHYGQMGSDGGRRDGATDVEHGESRKGGVEQA